jgi:hypothetical protein
MTILVVFLRDKAGLGSRSFWGYRGLLLPIWLAACLACGGDRTPTGSVTVTDSAGISVVSNPAPLWNGFPDRKWELGKDPEFRILGDPTDPVQALFGVVGVHRAENGRFVVANGGTQELLVFDSAGGFQEIWGGPGQGPDEFDGMFGLVTCAGDTMVVRQRRRVSILSPNGRFLRTARTVGEMVPHPAFEMVAASSDCSSFLMAVRQLRDPAPGERVFSYPTELYWASVDGSPARHFDRFPGGEMLAINPGSPTGVRLVFGAEPRWASNGGVVVYGPANRPEYQVFSPEGELRRIVRWDTEPVMISEEEWNRYETERMRLIEMYPREAPAWPSKTGYPGSGLKPVYSELLVDDEGNVWAREYGFPNILGEDQNPKKWTVFDSAGQWLGAVVTPGKFRVFEIRHGLMIGVAKDEVDVPRIEGFRIRKGIEGGDSDR